jgi:hypothetical protein
VTTERNRRDNDKQINERTKEQNWMKVMMKMERLRMKNCTEGNGKSRIRGDSIASLHFRWHWGFGCKKWGWMKKVHTIIRIGDS